MQETLLKIVSTVNSYLADYILVILLVGVGLFFTVKTRFVQVRCFGEGMRKIFGNANLNGKKHKGGMSSFQAFTTAVAAQVGTGNIVGASGAILVGGPGAIFWMWVIAFFGMATIYAEAVLAQKTRVVHEDGTISGGPVYYIKTAFTGKFGKFLAGFFAVSVIIALGFVGTMVQSNSIGEAMNNAFGIPTWVMGLILVVISGLVFLGGISRLASVTEKLVPVMAIVYLLGGLVVIFAQIKDLPEAIGMIFKYAFQPQAIIGGGIGMALKTAISQGAKRGLFSNEAGMGSTPHAHAQAHVANPHDQGVTAMIGVFFDTFVVLTMTALIVIVSLYAGNGPLSTVGSAGAFTKTTLVAKAIGHAFGESNAAFKFGSIFIAICLLFFAFSTIISWNLFGRINFTYLFGNKKVTNIVYSLIAVVFVFIGTMFKNDLVWELTDFFNYLMVIPNVIALIALSNMVVKHLSDRDNGLLKPDAISNKK
jgi:AGCS family alanine or glycine:cation symporter